MYVPASDERKTKKATTLNVDTLVFDLEDGVAANQKVTLVWIFKNRVPNYSRLAQYINTLS